MQIKCQPNPCKNFGKCTELVDSFECTCHVGFHGKTCESKIDFQSDNNNDNNNNNNNNNDNDNDNNTNNNVNINNL